MQLNPLDGVLKIHVLAYLNNIILYIFFNKYFFKKQSRLMNFTCLYKIHKGNVWFQKSLRENMR